MRARERQRTVEEIALRRRIQITEKLVSNPTMAGAGCEARRAGATYDLLVGHDDVGTRRRAARTWGSASSSSALRRSPA